MLAYIPGLECEDQLHHSFRATAMDRPRLERHAEHRGCNIEHEVSPILMVMLLICVWLGCACPSQLETCACMVPRDVGILQHTCSRQEWLGCRGDLG